MGTCGLLWGSLYFCLYLSFHSKNVKITSVKKLASNTTKLGAQDLPILRPVSSLQNYCFFMNYFIVAVTAFFTVSNGIHYSFDMKGPGCSPQGAGSVTGDTGKQINHSGKY